MSTLSVDPAALRTTQPRFAEVSQTVTDAATALRRVLEAEGECWGHDETGEQFAKNYTPGSDEALTGLNGLATTFTGLSDNVRTIADTVESQNQAQAAATNAIAP
ncbi:WXG100 family type VII secretion target [Nocardia australiensis]|uniref:WXG100 family type VII secretion target n=1 Tax=Nocardia australiensis TaxID=2887191 RepID=UPI001D137A4E|nr:WXG100 family type VII secretion target [Nocardia australiensis]